MSTASTSTADHTALPRTDRTRAPVRFVLRTNRWWARWLLRRRYDVRLHGADLVPADGPVIYEANHIGILDGPLVAIFGPRPAHALTKQEMFTGRARRLLERSGQIPVDRFHPDPAAVKTCLRVLRSGGVVGIFPEGRRGPGDLSRFHHGAAYLALVTGAPVIPVTFLGTRPTGGHAGAVPARGSSVDLVFGAPWQCEPHPWPRRREQVLHASALLLQHMRGELDRARALTGRDLPGPLPAGETESDPDTGFVQQGAP